jgi:hypothetical protein
LTFAFPAHGCAGRAIPLTSVSGDQWVWPYFIDGQPTVLAFWNTNEMQCLRDVKALTTLDARQGSVQLVTVVTGRDRMEIDQWVREKRIKYPVLLDLEEELSGRLGVHSYPTYLFFGPEGKEVSRVEDIRTVNNWFDRERWLEKAGVVEPASGPVSPE